MSRRERAVDVSRRVRLDSHPYGSVLHARARQEGIRFEGCIRSADRVDAADRLEDELCIDAAGRFDAENRRRLAGRLGRRNVAAAAASRSVRTSRRSDQRIEERCDGVLDARLLRTERPGRGELGRRRQRRRQSRRENDRATHTTPRSVKSGGSSAPALAANSVRSASLIEQSWSLRIDFKECAAGSSQCSHSTFFRRFFQCQPFCVNCLFCVKTGRRGSMGRGDTYKAIVATGISGEVDGPPRRA